jgi:Rrf2 family protein
MKVSAQEEYGLRCLLQLARLGEGEFLTLGQIAEREGMSQANAGKVLWLLNKAGLVSSIRGTKGGYMLTRPAADVRLSEVIKVLDEPGRARLVRPHGRLRHPLGHRQRPRGGRAGAVGHHAGATGRGGAGGGRLDAPPDSRPEPRSGAGGRAGAVSSYTTRDYQGTVIR